MRKHRGDHHHFPAFSSIEVEAEDEASGSENVFGIGFPEDSGVSGMEGDERGGETWGEDALRKYVSAKPGRCVVVVDGYAVDVTKYLGEHVSSLWILRREAYTLI